ncbi:SsrA-binding protein SmpB [Helicobacter marmotae]|uniref:SsrA-binding protein n=1 Tax=Helicobacter marmotae TaxID=152490 RepID=A0A3D8I1B8_9HELI|nr:SsrA-binding protein SmpB [Helicobacter marmotae]RDU58922.1 SsrA-binding protein SmpB [Helicobacter marmotae]
MQHKIIAKNKKAYFDYEILETLEAGIVLVGSEVKSIRAGRVNLKDSFVKIIKGEAFLLNAHISFLEHTYAYFKPNERAPRKLLLHKKEIDKLFGKLSQQSLSIVPLNIYCNARNKIKLSIALVQGKKLYDKRQSIKKKMLEREARANMKDYGKKL